VHQIDEFNIKMLTGGDVIFLFSGM